MPTDKKPTITSHPFSAAQIAAAKAAATTQATSVDALDWSAGVVTPGGGVAATVAALRRSRGPGKKPVKRQVAIRLDPEILSAFKADGPGWQTRVNAALKEWLAMQATKNAG